MPIYEYACNKCGKLNDVWQKISDPPPAKCDGCGAENSLSKVMSRTSFVLKGGGWYSDLYSSTKKDAGTADAGSKATEGNGEAKKDSPAKTESSTSSTSASSTGST